jgi:hypothetical protein
VEEVEMKRLLGVALVLAMAGAASAGEWHIETVDSESRVDRDTSLALDDFGYPHISYYEGVYMPGGNAEENLKYARWDGDAWQIETVDSNLAVCVYCSLALDSSGYPHISYYDHTPNYDLKYARWDGDTWRIETVDSEGYVGKFTSLALDSSNYPHISYFDQSDTALKYARWDGSSWCIETVDWLGAVGMYTSLALDDSGRPHISYFDDPYRNLKYAYWDGANWCTETVDWEGDVGRYTSLALDSSGHPHISYFDNTFYHWDLKYARWDGDLWQIETVDSEWYVGWYTSLALDDSDRPHISYRDGSFGNLKYAHWNGSAWWIETVDSDGDVGACSSLALDDTGNPHISYFDKNPNYDLKYARWEGGPGVEDAKLFVNTCDEGVLVGWEITGDAPAGFTVLRSAGEGEPVEVSGALPGSAVRWLDTDAYDASDEGLKPLVYWLEVVEEDGTVSRFGPTEPVNFPGPVCELALSVHPNPATDSVTFDYTLPEEGRVTIALYDLAGRRVDTLVDAERSAGRHEYVYDASVLPPSVYLVHLETETGILTRRLVITR